MRERPLHRRHRLTSLDEDWEPAIDDDEYQRIAEAGEEALARRDLALRREGEALLSELVTDDDTEASWEDLLRRFVRERL